MIDTFTMFMNTSSRCHSVSGRCGENMYLRSFSFTIHGDFIKSIGLQLGEPMEDAIDKWSER
jgi:hypothetical protein